MRRQLGCRRAGTATTVVLMLVALAGCGESDASAGDTLTVYAAASLTVSFEELADDFESGHPGVEVELNLAGSSDLAAQIQEGAPADVFASADEAPMARLTQDDLTGSTARAFASNTLQIAVPPGNPGSVATLADLADPRLAVVVCAPEVPCGAAARTAAEAGGVRLSPVSEEQSVTDVLGKVTSGEADAGLVYVTDVLAAGDAVQGIAFPEAAGAVNDYPIATLSDADSPELAQEFVDLVLGEAGQRVLRDDGFAPAR